MLRQCVIGAQYCGNIVEVNSDGSAHVEELRTFAYSTGRVPHEVRSGHDVHRLARVFI